MARGARTVLRLLLVLPFAAPVSLSGQERVPAPEEVLGFVPGADSMLADWSQIGSYVGRLAEASGCGFNVELPRLPLSPSLRRLCAGLSKDPRELAVTGGEDYALLFTTSRAPEKWKTKVTRAAPGRALRITRIGAVTAEGKARFLDRHSRAVESPGEGFEHF